MFYLIFMWFPLEQASSFRVMWVNFAIDFVVSEICQYQSKFLAWIEQDFCPIQQ